MNELLYYGEFFVLTLIFSTIFAMGGVGSAIVLVPLFNSLGLPLNVAKAFGLFINSMSTITASIMNFLRGVLDIRATLPLAISSIIGAPLGAYSSKFIPPVYVKILLAMFIILAVFLMFKKKKEAKFHYTKQWVMVALGLGVGFLSGLMGVGGGSLILPALILLGFDAKTSAYMVSFVLPFSTLSGFFTYLTITKIDYLMLLDVSIAAILGGYLGDKIMHYRLTPQQVKKFIAVILILLDIKIIYSILHYYHLI
ncbi:conserved hypothetical protein [Lebetimonas natsushimae]|uniref:Probable membrane transporter protein n=1 Tax=Lebetimonas natsushimae TaxID=1936991 RepID=A0A292YFV5_9BACT|nr:sulfite exporter TauE/SafE family protein [Lebetimonas natsushimae]GAX87870.1 conserved hypothetical protein [Lebetimonas natsushimae]